MGGFSSILGSLAVVITGEIDDYLDDLARVSQAAGDTVGEVESKFKGLTEVGSQMAGLGAGLTAGITAPLAILSGLAIDAAGDMDSLTRGLTAVAGSSDEAAKQMARLQEVAKLPGLGLEEAVQGSIRLQAVGVAATDAEKYMMQFGNALATVGKGRADLDAVITQLVQMSSNTKVVAEDLKPIMERVPQVAQILKNAYGTINTEQLQKAGLTTQEVIGTMIAGLEQLPRVSGGIKNAFENLEDSSKRALNEVGKSFTPVIEKVVPIIETLLAKVQEAAQWFAQLPAPVQAAIGTVVALAAAIGPLLVAIGGITAAIGAAMPALTAVAAFFGTSVGLLAPWALAIGAVLAALVALGVWVNDNWEPIVAVLSTAWDGIAENWSAVWGAISGFLIGAWNAIAGATEVVWGPIVSFFTTIWDAIAPYFSAVWDGIKGTLEGVWNAIKGAASAVWGGIVSVFQTFLEWAAKIPGAAKLMNLDDVWKSAQTTAEELKKTQASTEALGNAFGALGVQSSEQAAKRIAELRAAVDTVALAFKEGKASAQDLKNAQTALDQAIKQSKASYKGLNLVLGDDKAAKAAAKHARAVADAWDAAHKRYEKAAEEAEKNRKWFEDAYRKIEQLDRQLEKSAADLATDFAKSHEDMRTAATKTVNVIVPETKRIPEEVQKAIKANADLEAAYKTLGVTSAAELNKQYGVAKDAYDKITASGTASANDIDKAWVEMEQRRQAAVTASGGVITAEQKKTLDAMEQQIDTSGKNQTTKWSEWSRQVSTVVTDLSKEMSSILFDGDLSWAEKGKKSLDALGQAFSRAFIEPVTTAIGDLMAGALKDLMGGKGFGGLKQGFEDAGAAFKRIFGKGGEAASDVADLGGAVMGGGGSAGGGAAGAAGAAPAAGLAGIVTAVAGVVTAISSVIGNFQMAKMETTLNAIEHETRYAQIHLLHILEDGVNKYLPKLDSMNGFLWDVFQPALASLMSTVESIESGSGRVADRLQDWLEPIWRESNGKWQLYEDRLYEISSNTFYSYDALRETNSLLAQIRDQSASRPAQVVINVSGAGSPAQTADAVRLKLQGVML